MTKELSGRGKMGAYPRLPLRDFMQTMRASGRKRILKALLFVFQRARNVYLVKDGEAGPLA